MPKAKYKLEDFIITVNEDYKKYVDLFHEILLQSGFKLKIQSTKSYGLHLSYFQPAIKSVKGIVI